jgi:hypothetical protein
MSTSRRAAVLSAVAVGSAAAVLAALGSSGVADAAARRPSSNQFLFTFDHHESLKPGTRVVDASGHRHAGTVLVEDGGTLRPRPGVTGRSAKYPRHGRAIIEIADRKGLDPHRHGFAFGGVVREKRAQAAFGANLVQKGYYNQDGGQWKLQLKSGGVPSCVVFGALGRLKADATHSVANGHWHLVTCTRTPSGLTIRVDGRVVASESGPTGLIANDAPVKVGGKKTAAGNKQFRGRIDNVFLRLLPKGS